MLILRGRRMVLYAESRLSGQPDIFVRESLTKDRSRLVYFSLPFETTLPILEFHYNQRFPRMQGRETALQPTGKAENDGKHGHLKLLAQERSDWANVLARSIMLWTL